MKDGSNGSVADNSYHLYKVTVFFGVKYLKFI